MNKRILAVLMLCVSITVLISGCKSPEEIQQSSQSANGIQTITIRQEPAEELNLLTVNGMATVRAKPDTATFELVVRTQPATEDEDGIAVNETAVQSVVDALSRYGIAGEQVAVSECYQYPQNAVDEENKHLGYTEETRLVVTVNRFEQLAMILAEAETAGAVVVVPPEYFLEDASPAYQQALIQATQAAQEKAAALAQTMGVALTVQRSLAEEAPSITAVRDEDPGSELLITAQVTLTYSIE